MGAIAVAVDGHASTGPQFFSSKLQTPSTTSAALARGGDFEAIGEWRGLLKNVDAVRRGEEGALFDKDDDGGGGGIFHYIDDLTIPMHDRLGESGPLMHDLNLNNCGGSGDFCGMGMGLGEIPLSSHQATLPPMFASYRPPSKQG